MDGLFTEFLFWKAVALVVIVGVVNFVYTLITGKSLTEARRERKEE